MEPFIGQIHSFCLPDLWGRSNVGMGSAPGLNPINQGESWCTEIVTLATNNMASHNHVVSVSVNTGNGEESAVQNSFISNHAGACSEAQTTGAVLGWVSLAPAVGGQAFSTRNPYLGNNVCNALQGIFPSRN